MTSKKEYVDAFLLPEAICKGLLDDVMLPAPEAEVEEDKGEVLPSGVLLWKSSKWAPVSWIKTDYFVHQEEWSTCPYPDVVTELWRQYDEGYTPYTLLHTPDGKWYLIIPFEQMYAIVWDESYSPNYFAKEPLPCDKEYCVWQMGSLEEISK